jgi:hypothetical protein
VEATPSTLNIARLPRELFNSVRRRCRKVFRETWALASPKAPPEGVIAEINFTWVGKTRPPTRGMITTI